MITTQEEARILAELRPPSARPMRLVRGFSISHEDYNFGITLELAEGEPAVAPGDGVIIKVSRDYASFKHSEGPLSGAIVYTVSIRHGAGIVSNVAGLASVNASADSKVSRGDVLGPTLTREVFFSVVRGMELVNPYEISRHFSVLQGSTAASGSIRYAPDTIARNVANTVRSVISNGVRYILDLIGGPKPLLLSVDFNGTGLKSGFAATGLTVTDYWNVYAAGEFSSTYSYNYGYVCCPAMSIYFSRSPRFALLDSNRKPTGIWLERIAPATAAHGYRTVSHNWDEMAKSWIGGWTSGIPEENFFAIRGLPPGTYTVWLYASSFGRSPSTATVFYVSIGNGAPVTHAMTTEDKLYWFEYYNFVKFESLAVSSGATINVKAYGYFDGMQIMRS